MNTKIIEPKPLINLSRHLYTSIMVILEFAEDLHEESAIQVPRDEPENQIPNDEFAIQIARDDQQFKSFMAKLLTSLLYQH